MALPLNGQRHDRTALILYGSETGNSQDVAEELGLMAERLHFMTRVKEMDLVEISDLSNYTVILFAVSTAGQGEFPQNAKKFWKRLLRKRLPPGCLNHVSFTTFGLGDSSYPKFNFTARKLHKRLIQLGANEVYPRGEGDDQHDEGIDGTFLPWAYDLRRNLLLSYPLPDGVEPIPIEVHLPPKFALHIITETTTETITEKTTRNSIDQTLERREIQSSAEDLKSASSPSANTTAGDLVESLTQVSNSNAESTSDEKYLSNAKMLDHRSPFEPTGPLPCSQLKEPHPDAEIPIDWDFPSNRDPPLPDGHRVQLLSNIRVTPDTHWQDVRELTFKINHEYGYDPGDTMTIFPKNFPQDVQALIDLQDWNEVADKPIRIIAEPPNFFTAADLMELVPAGVAILANTTLRDLLTCYLDITAIPKRMFFSRIAYHTNDKAHKERLFEFQNPAFSDEFFDYTSRPRRGILEVLEDFPSVKLPWKWAFGFFPLLRGRKYSICSGGFLKNHPEKNCWKIQILVAIVKYRTVLKKVRQGVCSRYLASLDPLSYIRVELGHDAAFTKISLFEYERPIIMIAPGTGVAPCRSLIYERAQIQLEDFTADIAPCYLFFGGRNKDSDYFFKSEWENRGLPLKVFTAFSRDQPKKIYVQDIIREQGQMIADLMRGSPGPMIYVCGSSGNMPKAVREAILDVMEKQLEDPIRHITERRLYELDDPTESRKACEKQLAEMEKNGLYIQETW